MRVGKNPHKDQLIQESTHIHQVVIPVYIPNQEGYFKDSFKILRLCVDSLLSTVHYKTFVTIVNNGSCREVNEYLNDLYINNKIQELVHTENIGKLNAIIKGLAGNNIELVTISDADVLFLPNWQEETTRVFYEVPKAGVVGIVPQFKMYEAHCGNAIIDNLFNKGLRFLPVKNPEALKLFYDSVGWDRNYNQDYLKYNLGLEIKSDLKVLIGSGHFVATYKKDIFKEITSYFDFKLGGSSEIYLDKAPLRNDYWRLTTYDNYAYHMGNVFEDWMVTNFTLPNNQPILSNFKKKSPINFVIYFIKNRLFVKFISIRFFNKLFLKKMGLPKGMIDKY